MMLLKCIGMAVLKAGVRALCGGLPLGDFVVDLAESALDHWRAHQSAPERTAELQAVAQATPQEVRQQVKQVVAEIASDQPGEVREALTAYLMQVPGAIRQSLRRPSDPSGRTAPIHLELIAPENLLPFLPTRMPRFKPGDRPAGLGDWELVELLGIGGFGEVWKARNPHLPNDPPAALKFCLDPTAAASLRNEAMLLSRVKQEGKHPGIVELRHTYFTADPPCLECEYVEGGDLAGLILDWHRSPDGVTSTRAAEVILELARTMAFTHQLRPALVHRDLKPANILVQKRKAGHRFKIADFGIGGLAAGHAIRQATRAGTSRGQMLATGARGAYTPLYASPQQMRGDEPDPRDDVYALGVIWYQLLTGNLTAGAPGGLNWVHDLRKRGLPKGMIDVLASCLEPQPDGRPANAAVLESKLLPWLTPLEAIAVTPSPNDRGRKEPARRRPEEKPRKPGKFPIRAVLLGLGLFFLILLMGGAFIQALTWSMDSLRSTPTSASAAPVSAPSVVPSSAPLPAPTPPPLMNHGSGRMCSVCFGKGRTTCGVCGGMRGSNVAQPDPFYGMRYHWQNCAACGGTGEAPLLALSRVGTRLLRQRGGRERQPHSHCLFPSLPLSSGPTKPGAG